MIGVSCLLFFWRNNELILHLLNFLQHIWAHTRPESNSIHQTSHPKEWLAHVYKDSFKILSRWDYQQAIRNTNTLSATHAVFFDQVQWPCTRKVTVQGGDQQYLEATWCSLGADAITYDEVEDNMVAEVFPSLDRIPFQPPPTGVYALKLIPVFCRTKGRCKEREFSFNPRTSWHAGTRAGEHAVFSTLLIDVTARTQ